MGAGLGGFQRVEVELGLGFAAGVKRKQREGPADGEGLLEVGADEFD
jgi:hypothetical protein